MSFGKRALSALGKLGIIIAIAVAFLFGLGATIYLSLRTAEVQVPNIVGQDFLAAETTLSDAGLNVRKRATRPTADKPNVILDQLPRAGEVVKIGQTVAVDVSRAPKEGEYVPSAPTTEEKPEDGQKNDNQNANDSTAAKNQNQNANNSNNSNQNQNKRPKNTNKNANNSNNANNANNRNANNRNANNRNATNGNNANNRNANANRTNANGGNRNATNLNTNRRAPVPTTTPAGPGGNTRTP